MATAPSGKIFNVEEPTGADAVKFETTAAAAQIEAPNAAASRAVEKNAEIAQDAANTAAAAAKSFGKEFTGEPPSTTEKLQTQAQEITNTAVSEGKQDVEVAKATSAGYVDQAKAMASVAVTTAQNYISSATGATSDTTQSRSTTTATGSGPGVVSQLQSGANVALETTKGYLATAQQTVQPHIEKGVNVASNYIGSLQQQANPNTGTGAKDSDIPATSAPLESGPHTVGTPYPSTTTTAGTNVGQNAS
ncbi:hypothetical protein K435DRAFT_788459 [Dendrothele bispora CBS 962.96]|uniref:Uncharacterized protein n=1 Tax=Dendrothele bispora (strain CBS 962.96) TaxID=1314807 RepID=A0A4S8MWW4_DENBC|nr:hypothetical protein K435DRAFT_788459 [Dendrothele bispora CBS 962.96]